MQFVTSVGLSLDTDQFSFEFSGAFDEEGKGDIIMYLRPLKEYATGMYLRMDKEACQVLYEHLGRVLDGETVTSLASDYDTVVQPLHGGLDDDRDVHEA